MRRAVASWPISGLILPGTLVVLTLGLALMPHPHSSTTSGGLSLTISYLLFFSIFCSLAFGCARDHLKRKAYPSEFGWQRWWNLRHLGWLALAASVWAGVLLLSGLVSHKSGQSPLTGAHDSDIGRFSVALLAIVLAPMIEEFLFRGFTYRCLRSRLSVIPAALIGGLLFGLCHFEGFHSWPAVVVISLHGIILCLLFEKTGSLFPGILLHGLNNSISIAFGSTHSPVAAAGSIVVLLAVTLLWPRRISRREDAQRATAPPPAVVTA